MIRNLLIGPKIASQKASDGIFLGEVPPAVHLRVLLERQVGLLGLGNNVESEESVIAIQISQFQGLDFEVPIDGRSIQEGGKLKYLKSLETLRKPTMFI